MSTETRQIPPGIDPSGRRMGPIWLVPGVTLGNAYTLLFVAFGSISLTTFINFIQPYILTEHLHIPAGTRFEPGEQGQAVAILGLVQELAMLSVLLPVGVLSDKIGRRNIYAMGFCLLAVGFILYPTASSLGELVIYRFFYGVGAASIVAMLATVQADYPQDPTRGKMIGICGFLQGLGVVAAVFTLTRLPLFYSEIAGDAVWAGRFSLWTVAVICLFVALVARLGLKRGVPDVESTQDRIWDLVRTGIRAARNPRIALSYGAAMISRGDLVMVSNFFSLWLFQTAIASGLSGPAAALEAGKFQAFVQLCAVLWAPIIGIMIDRLNRVTALCIACGLAAMGYLSLGLVSDPLGPQMFVAGAILGIGEISAVLAAQALIGQEAPNRERGSVFGVFGFFGAIGITIALAVGGYLFDNVAPAGPFVFMGAGNVILLVLALVVRFRWGSPDNSYQFGNPKERVDS